MKSTGWGVVFVTTQALSRVRQITLSRFLMVGFLFICIIGFIGMGRLFYFTGSYASAKLGVYKARRENNSMIMKVQFIKKFIEQENKKIEELVDFEDNIRLQYGFSPISKEIRQAGVGGRPTPAELLLSNMLDPVLTRAEAVKESLAVMIRRAELQDSTISNVSSNVNSVHKKWEQRPSIWPAEGRLTSPFGSRFHPILGRAVFHDGIDIANRVGTPVCATAEGYVSYVGYKEYYGKIVRVKHNNSKFETVYAHLNKTIVSRGSSIKKGELIGYMGNSGRSTGSHLHYEVRVDGRPLNPRHFILPTDVVID